MANFRSRTNSSSVSINSWMVAVLFALASSSGVGPSVRWGRLDLNSRIWASICCFIWVASSPESSATDLLIDETTAACLEISSSRAGTYPSRPVSKSCTNHRSSWLLGLVSFACCGSGDFCGDVPIPLERELGWFLLGLMAAFCLANVLSSSCEASPVEKSSLPSRRAFLFGLLWLNRKTFCPTVSGKPS